MSATARGLEDSGHSLQSVSRSIRFRARVLRLQDRERHELPRGSRRPANASRSRSRPRSGSSSAAVCAAASARARPGRPQTVPTGTLRHRTIDRKRIGDAFQVKGRDGGMPITGSSVSEDVMPGRWAEPPAARMMTCKSGFQLSRPAPPCAAAVRCAERTRADSKRTPSASRVAKTF